MKDKNPNDNHVYKAITGSVRAKEGYLLLSFVAPEARDTVV